MGQEAALKSVGLEFLPEKPAQTDLKDSIFQEDDYFKKNLPASYGSVSQSPPLHDRNSYNVEESVFGGETGRITLIRNSSPLSQLSIFSSMLPRVSGSFQTFRRFTQQ